MGTVTMLSATDGNQMRFDIKKAPKKLSSAKIVSVDGSHCAYLALSSKGTIYGINIRQTSSYFYAGVNWGWTPKMAHALYELGVLSFDDMEYTVMVNRDLRKKDEDRWNAISLKKDAKEIGIKLTKHQLSILDKMENNHDRN